jgi:hypothetical protein
MMECRSCGKKTDNSLTTITSGEGGISESDLMLCADCIASLPEPCVGCGRRWDDADYLGEHDCKACAEDES